MALSLRAQNNTPVIKWHGPAVTAAVAADVERRLDAAAEVVKNTATDAMRGPKTGAPGPITRRSAPGEAPAGQAGDLIGSVAQGAPAALKRIVGTSLPYGKFLELGTKDIAPRPWLEVSLWASINKIKALFRGSR